MSDRPPRIPRDRGRRSNPGTSRRNVNRRHIDIETAPLRTRRSNLNRVTLSIAAIFALIVVATIFLPGPGGGLGGDNDTPGAIATAPVAPTMVPVPGAVPVEVVRIIDGDTLDVRSAETQLRVRLFGVDTPERGEACYQEATDRLAELAGTVVQLLPDERLEDPHGRALRYVYAFDGTLIDELLVTEGYGKAWTRDGALRDQIVAEEEAAQAAGRGCLWETR